MTKLFWRNTNRITSFIWPARTPAHFTHGSKFTLYGIPDPTAQPPRITATHVEAFMAGVALFALFVTLVVLLLGAV